MNSRAPPSLAEPGTRYSYTTYGYNLLGAAIEGASGQPYADFPARNAAIAAATNFESGTSSGTCRP